MKILVTGAAGIRRLLNDTALVLDVKGVLDRAEAAAHGIRLWRL